MTTFRDLLTTRLRHRPGDPLVTFYDEATGERTELSVTTYANWVAKMASLLVDELGLERGDRLLVDLPAHWLGPVVLGAAWTAGLEVVWDGEPDAVVCGPDALGRWAARATELPVVATALLPLGVRFTSPLADGVHDLGVAVWGQPDSFVPWDPPTEDDPAVAGTSHGALWAGASSGTTVSSGARLLSTASPTSAAGLASFTDTVATGGSLVLVRHATPPRLDAIAAAERATARWDGQPTRS
ncbi:MAG: TIGR03089 family protein [Nocardioidaceae bacterium]|nr:TIGR03089 family protein [Nocardioidaceae bacterium]